MDKVCTVIVTYNGAKWIEKCMQHLFASKYPSSIVVIDNHSTDNTLQLLQPYIHKIQLVQSNQNLGFGQGNNIGIRIAKDLQADFIFLLNQDVYVSEDCIGSLVATLKEHSSFGIISPLQLDSSGAQLDEAFKKYVQKVIPEEDLKKMLQPGFQPLSFRPIGLRFVNAAAWMISKEAIQKVGLFHPAFIHYGEDNHYSSRLQYHKLNIGVSGNANVIHDSNEEKPAPEKLLIRKLKTVPLYTLLDIRKPLPVAWLSGFLKLRQIKKKLAWNYSKKIAGIYAEQKKWFTVKLKEAIQIREETKKIYEESMYTVSSDITNH